MSEISVQPKRDTFLITSTVLLVLFTAAFLGVAFLAYRNRVQSVTLRESRFVRTEWHLLADLKAQTDQELLEKDQEIADLNQRYLSLLHHSGNQAALQQVESMIQQAKAQRAAIVARRDAADAGNSSDPKAWVDKLLPSANASGVSQLLLQSQVAALEAQLSKSREQTQTLAAEVRRLSSAQVTLKRELALEEQKAAKSPPASIEELDTRALVRAIIGSPQIRSVYPDLLSSLDTYLTEYALQERAKGQEEAYASAMALLAQIDHSTATRP